MGALSFGTLPTNLLGGASDAFGGANWQAARRSLARLCPPGTRLLVATSGGPDSQALLAWSAALARPLGLVHLGAVGIDHGTRTSAKAELSLARDLATRCGLAYLERTIELPAGGNRLAAARTARRAALVCAARAAGAARVLVGHHRDDLAETLLWHLLRGSASAMGGAMPARQGKICRPLLAVSRPEILAALEALRVPFASDPSNEAPGRMRASMRSTIWPAIETLQPAAKRLLCSGLLELRAEQRWLSKRGKQAAGRLAAERAGRHAFDLAAWRRLACPLRRRALRHWLCAKGITPSGAQLASLAARLLAPNAQEGGRLAAGSLPGGTLRWREPWLEVCAASDLRPRRPVRRPAPATTPS